ncbi:glycosyl transferase family 2 [Desulfurispirillum indicum S5]|uniref:Glycosyl transferase family 2 n=1 Tax=Desulfurispirillum indicum (strain ATCC BAA-1389 / DSM 22839 / S5) TaxID=653733 RepID=E6W5A6_DESIS|nr:glycosyltransferase family 2 protein [Desulfurispirillum indicum]ADU67185.1 glycosyl transferase family 2 [Desulfurispirillum indicum S5]
MTRTVDILLATYNGAEHLPELLGSILKQSFADWRLIVRDDGSTDATLGILEAFSREHGNRMVLLPRQSRNLGPCGNFAVLMEYSSADYVMFCDQDDVWLPEKITCSLEKMQELEAVCGEEKPLLVHTDMVIVDRGLQELAASGHRYQRIDPLHGARLPRLLVQNVVTGCTAMMNRRLCKMALPIADAALMHDHWVGLVASCFGGIAYVPKPMLLYRQHGGNQVGASSGSALYLLRQVCSLARVREVLSRNRKQAKAFYERFQVLLPEPDRAMLEAFITMEQQGMLKRRIHIFHYGFRYSGMIRNIGWLVLC